MQADMIFDYRQIYIYYQHSFNPNGTYNEWSIEYNNANNQTNFQTVSPSYLYAAAVIWVLPPIIAISPTLLVNIYPNSRENFWKLLRDKLGTESENTDIIRYHREFNPFFLLNLVLLQCNIDKIIPRPSKKTALNILVYIMCLPFDILCSAIHLYIFHPFVTLKSGVIVAWKGEIDPAHKVTRLITVGDIPMHKLYEQLGEAIPQSILCLLFIINNFPFLLHHETSFFSIPVSCISLVFSVVSVAMGLYSGISSFIHFRISLMKYMSGYKADT